jgi:hypothetical protein
MANIRDLVENLAPPWLRRFWGRRLVGVVQGLMGDAVVEASMQALQAPWLRSGFQPPDALPLVGGERRMPRYPADTDATYRSRLADAWNTWLRGGNEGSVVGQLNAFGLPAVVVLPAENTGQYDHATGVRDPLAGSADYGRRRAWRFEEPPRIRMTVNSPVINAANPGPNQTTITNGGELSFTATTSTSRPFYVGGKVLIESGSALNNNRYVGEISSVTASTITIDEVIHVTASTSYVDETPAGAVVLDGTNWSRFAVIIEQPHPWTSWNYGDPNKFYGGSDDSPTYGTTATVGQVNSVKAIIRKWRAAHVLNPRIYVVLSGEYYGDPTLEYGDVGLAYGAGSVVVWDHQV